MRLPALLKTLWNPGWQGAMTTLTAVVTPYQPSVANGPAIALIKIGLESIDGVTASRRTVEEARSWSAKARGSRMAPSGSVFEEFP